MEIKTYLRRYLAANREIDALLEEIGRLRALACKVTAALGDEPHTTGEPDRVGAIISRIVDMERTVDERIDQLGRIKQEVEQTIGQVADGRQRSVLRLRYINGWTWERIAVEMGYCYMQVCRLHGKALQAIKLPTP